MRAQNCTRSIWVNSMDELCYAPLLISTPARKFCHSSSVETVHGVLFAPLVRQGERILMSAGLKVFTRAALRTGLALLFVTAMARPASADWLFTPYYGIVFGGAANTVDIDTLDEAFEQRSTFGGSLSGQA